MLIIRESQMRVLAEHGFRENLIRLSQEMMVDLFPTELREVSVEERKRRIEYGVRSAFARGLSDLKEIRLYTEASLLLGVGFDSDGSCPWVDSLLNDTTGGPMLERLRVLCTRALISARLRASDQANV